MEDDRSGIVTVVNLYAVALDSHRYGLFDEIFTPDIKCDFGGGAAFANRALLVSVFKTIHAVFAATQHITAGHVVRVQGDEAKCFSYVSARFRRVVEGEDALFESTGWYDDVLVRLRDGWRIKERVSRMVSHNGDIRVMQAMPGMDTNYQLYALYAQAEAGAVKFFER